MPWVSAEQIEQARKIGLLEYLQAHEPHELIQKGNEYRTATHGSLVIWHGYWYWNRGCFGGESALDYLVEIRGMAFVDAVTLLCDARLAPVFANRPKKPQPQAAPDRKPFLLPPRNRDHFRVISYLMGRSISREVIDRCIEQGVLYESARYHNAVFVGRNWKGKARFAALHGLHRSFKQDVPGSDKRHGFCLPPVSMECTTVAVFEAPIDALSHATLRPGMDCYRLSLGGTSPLAFIEFLEHHPQIRHVELCLDNDEAGRNGVEKIKTRLREDTRFAGLEIWVDAPPPEMDYNEKLIQHTKREQESRRRAAVSL